MSDRLAELEREIADVNHHLEGLQRDWTRIPWVGLLALLAVPAGYLFGLLAIVLVVSVTVIIAIVTMYIIMDHRRTYLERLDDLEAEQRRLGPR